MYIKAQRDKENTHKGEIERVNTILEEGEIMKLDTKHKIKRACLIENKENYWQT